MQQSSTDRIKLALVYGTLPVIEEIDQLSLISEAYDVEVITTVELAEYIKELTLFNGLKIKALPDHMEDLTFLPGLEKALAGYDVVIVKERLGFYAYQAVKAKWKEKFKLFYWIDNLTPFPGQDLDRMRTIRDEANNGADGFLVQTNSAKHMLTQIESVEESRVFKIPPFVSKRAGRNSQDRAKSREALTLSESHFVIAHLGQIEWEEGLLDLVNGVKIAISNRLELSDKLRIVLCGIGSFSEELRERLKLLDMEQYVQFVKPSRAAITTVLNSADAIFHSSVQSRDRLEGDPYRLLTAMVHGIPVITGRSPLVEEFLGKHRIDFCTASPVSISHAVVKANQANGLKRDIVAKNFQKIENYFNKEKAQSSIQSFIHDALKSISLPITQSFDEKVLYVEEKIQQKKFIDAIQLIEQLFSHEELPIHHKANLLRMVGDCFTKLGDNESGLESYQKALDVDPFCSKIHLGIGTVNLVRQQYDVAMINFQKAVTFAPEDEMALLGLGLAFQGQGSFEEAQKWVVKSLKVAPKNTAAIYTLVQIASSLEKYDIAVEQLENYTKLVPNDLELLYTLAVLRYKLEDFDSAESLLDKILAADFSNKNAKNLKSALQKTKAALGT